ncbi:MAG TPA: DUF2061 domain-containing protein [Marinagarivorans sp.]
MSKAITFTAMHFSIAFAVAWALTGDIWVGGLVAIVEPAVNSVAYVFHEKFWRWHNKRRDSRCTQRLDPSFSAV